MANKKSLSPLALLRVQISDEANKFASLYGKQSVTSKEHESIGKRMHQLRGYLEEFGEPGEYAGEELKKIYLDLVNELAIASQKFLDHLDDDNEDEIELDAPVAQAAPSVAPAAQAVPTPVPAAPVAAAPVQQAEAPHEIVSKGLPQAAPAAPQAAPAQPVAPQGGLTAEQSAMMTKALDKHLDAIKNLEASKVHVSGLFKGRKIKKIDASIAESKLAVNKNGKLLVEKYGVTPDQVKEYIQNKKNGGAKPAGSAPGGAAYDLSQKVNADGSAK